MEVEMVKCECCGMKEDCTADYINGVKSKFGGRWLCGLCSEAVRYELSRSGKTAAAAAMKEEDAVRAHMSFCRKNKCSPAFRVADGMRQMLRRRSSSEKSMSVSSPSSVKKYARSATTSQVADESSFLY